MDKFYSKTQFVQSSINVWKEHLFEDFPIHYHDFSELVIITKGAAAHVIDNIEYSIQAGDVYVIKGNTRHGFINVKDLTLYNIAYVSSEPILEYNYLRSMSGFQALFFVEPLYRKKAKFEHKLHLQHKDLLFAERLLEIMSNEKREYALCERILKIHLTSFITFLSRQYELNNEVSDLKHISDTLAYIEKNYTENIEIEELALQAHISTRHFNRLFISNYGITPKQYILKLRIQYACKQMLDSNKSISQIAAESGFNDTNYFTNYFKKKTGQTPREFRLTPRD